jgi:outer membrane protein TolC
MIRIILTILFISYSSLLHAEDVFVKLGVREFIDLAKKHDPNFAKIINNEEQLKIFAAKNSPYQPTIFSYQHEYGVDGKNDIETSNFTSAIAKEFVTTGTNIKLEYAGSDRFDKEEEVTEFGIYQSLYKNAFGRIDRLKKAALELEEQISYLEVLESYENYISYIIIQYLDFQKLYLDKILAENIYKEAENLKENILLKQEKNIAIAQDVDQAELLLLIREEELINKNKEFLSKWTIIKQIIGAEDLVIPAIDMYELLELSLHDTSLHNLRLLQIVNIKEDIARKEVKLSEYDNKPTMQLYGGYRTDQSKRYSTSVDNNEMLAGVKLQVPLGNIVAKAHIDDAKYNLIDQEITKKLLIKDLEKNILNLNTQLTELRKKEVISRNKIKIMERILKEEENKYNYGKIDLTRLIESKNNFSAYRYTHQADLLNINIKIIEILSLNDQLLALVK